jgi:hypothetical protein
VDIDISLLDFLRRDITRQTDDSGSLAVLVLEEWAWCEDSKVDSSYRHAIAPIKPVESASSLLQRLRSFTSRYLTPPATRRSSCYRSKAQNGTEQEGKEVRGEEDR